MTSVVSTMVSTLRSFLSHWMTCSVLSPPSCLICSPLLFQRLLLLPRVSVLPFWRRSLCAVALPNNKKYKIHSVVTIENGKRFELLNWQNKLVEEMRHVRLWENALLRTSSRKELLERNPCWSCSSQMSASLPLDLPLHSPPSIGTNPTFETEFEESLERRVNTWSSEEHVVNCSLRAVCTVDPTTLAPTAPAASTAASFRSLSSPHQLLVLLLLPHCQSSLWFSLSISFTR